MNLPCGKLPPYKAYSVNKAQVRYLELSTKFGCDQLVQIITYNSSALTDYHW